MSWLEIAVVLGSLVDYCTLTPALMAVPSQPRPLFALQLHVAKRSGSLFVLKQKEQLLVFQHLLLEVWEQVLFSVQVLVALRHRDVEGLSVCYMLSRVRQLSQAASVLILRSDLLGVIVVIRPLSWLESAFRQGWMSVFSAGGNRVSFSSRLERVEWLEILLDFLRLSSRFEAFLSPCNVFGFKLHVWILFFKQIVDQWMLKELVTGVAWRRLAYNLGKVGLSLLLCDRRVHLLNLRPLTLPRLRLGRLVCEWRRRSAYRVCFETRLLSWFLRGFVKGWDALYHLLEKVIIFL